VAELLITDVLNKSVSLQRQQMCYWV